MQMGRPSIFTWTTQQSLVGLLGGGLLGGVLLVLDRALVLLGHLAGLDVLLGGDLLRRGLHRRSSRGSGRSGSRGRSRVADNRHREGESNGEAESGEEGL